MSKTLQPPRPMTHFERLGLPEAPNLTLEAVQRAFKDASLHVHPDRIASNDPLQKLCAAQHTAALGEAYTVLKNPVSRLLYLISLRTPETPEIIQEADIVMTVIQLRERAEMMKTPEERADFLKELGAETQELIERISELLNHPSPNPTELTRLGLRLRYFDKAYHDIENHPCC